MLWNFLFCSNSLIIQKKNHSNVTGIYDKTLRELWSSGFFCWFYVICLSLPLVRCTGLTVSALTIFFFCFSLGADQELRNVIDKLAQFVARNGPEFEKMTMEKQKDNPKFSFLFGGEYFSYYKCKLAMEQQHDSHCV